MGRRRELVQRVLFVLSYFIRCSDLQENEPTQTHTDHPSTPCPPQTTDATSGPDGSSEEPVVGSESENTAASQSAERRDGREQQECFGEAGLEDIPANPSPPGHRARFTIGSPKEPENRWSGVGCGRDSHRKMPNRHLVDRVGYDEEDSSPDMQECELPLPR